MTEYELQSLALQKVNLWIGGIYSIFTIIIAAGAIWGERIRQIWASPKLHLSLDEPNLTSHQGIDRKGWYYQLRIQNKKKRAAANNVRVLLFKVMKKGPDGEYHEQKFSGPTQVTWKFPVNTPQFLTVGYQYEHATFGKIVDGSDSFELSLYLLPLNLNWKIAKNDPTRLAFKAIADNGESDTLTLELSWDGTWTEGRDEMAKHLIVKKID